MSVVTISVQDFPRWPHLKRRQDEAQIAQRLAGAGNFRIPASTIGDIAGRIERRFRRRAKVKLSLSPIRGLVPHRHLYGGFIMYT